MCLCVCVRAFFLHLPRFAVDIAQLMEGLRLLNQADPSVEAYIQESGEHVIVTAGEVHAEVWRSSLINISSLPPPPPIAHHP